ITGTPARAPEGESGPFRLPGASGAPSRVILVASDASELSDAAVRIASQLHERLGCDPRVISVLPPLPGVVPPIGGALVAVPTAQTSVARSERRRREVEVQLRQTAGDAGAWPIAVAVGLAADIVVEEVQAHDAALVVLGLRRHGVLEHVFRDDVAAQVMRASPVPTLAVVSALRTLPRRVIVATDFSRASVRAAQAALQVTGDDGELLLVHVTHTAAVPDEDSEGTVLVRTLGVQEAFARLMRDLAPPSGISLVPTVLEGTAPAAVLLELAARTAVDRGAIGAHRRPAVERFFLGSVAQTVMREAPCSVLVARGTAGAPPSPPESEDVRA
ncbi:MAG TPA: universal stress protein, partial [Gemmatimonadales bacterium]|nr:universal stress protein [Gemmatimonadales bacterium]